MQLTINILDGMFAFMGKARLTRQEILEKSFEMIYRNGYQSTSIDRIIATTPVTKGAFYHHFGDKNEMGLAMIKEVITPKIVESLVKPLSKGTDPLTTIFEALKADLLGKDFDPQFGCPINNLVMEMSPVNQEFREQLQGVIEYWRNAIISALDRGIEGGVVRQGVDSKEVAEFIIASYEGSRGTGKVLDGRGLYFSYLNQIKSYLDSLRA